MTPPYRRDTLKLVDPEIDPDPGLAVLLEHRSYPLELTELELCQLCDYLDELPGSLCRESAPCTKQLHYGPITYRTRRWTSDLGHDITLSSLGRLYVGRYYIDTTQSRCPEWSLAAIREQCEWIELAQSRLEHAQRQLTGAPAGKAREWYRSLLNIKSAALETFRWATGEELPPSLDNVEVEAALQELVELRARATANLAVLGV